VCLAALVSVTSSSAPGTALCVQSPAVNQSPEPLCFHVTLSVIFLPPYAQSGVEANNLTGHGQAGRRGKQDLLFLKKKKQKDF
jgi:hypothetical protein